MSNRAVHTDRAPEAVGPYSQAVAVELAGGRKMVFTAGQIGLDPSTMQIVEGGIEAQTRQVVSNLTAILEAAGAGWRDVVKSTVFLADIQDFGAFNEIYAEAVGDPLPARSAAAVRDLPKDCLLEMDLVAVCNG